MKNNYFDKVKVHHLRTRLLWTLFIIFSAGTTFGGTVTTSGSGNWSSTTPGLPWPGGTIPAAGDDIIIRDGFTLTVNGNVTCNSIGFGVNALGASTGTLAVNGGFQLIVITSVSAPSMGLIALGNANYNLSGLGTISCVSFNCNNSSSPVSISDRTIKVISNISNLIVSGNFTLNGTNGILGNRNNPTFNLQSGTVTVDGSLSSVNTSASNVSTFDMVTSAASPTLFLGGAVPFNLSGTGTNNINLNGTGATVDYYRGGNQPIRATTYTNLNTSGSATKTASGNITVAGILNIGSVTAFDGSTFTTTMNGTGWSIVNNGTLNFNGLTIAETPATQSSASYSVGGALTVNASKTLAPAAGTITRTGTAWSSVFTGSAVFFNYTIAGTPSTQPSASYSVAGALTVNTSTILAPTTGSTITMTSTTSAISNSGTLTFNNLTTNNSNGLAITGAITVNGILNFQGGLITPSISITIGSSGSITNASSSKYVNGKLNIVFSGTGGKVFPIGKGGNYRPVTFQYITLTGTPSTVSFEQFESQMSGSLPSGTNIDPNRYWDFSQSGGTSFTYKVTLDPTGFTSTGTVGQLKKDGAPITFNTTTTPNYTNSASYSTISSPTSISLGCDCSSTSASAGPDQNGLATCELTNITLAGNTPPFGTGVWTVFSGAGGSFGSTSNPTSTFGGTEGTAYTLRWTITNGNCTSSDDVNVIFNARPDITAQPISATSCVGKSQTFTVNATGTSLTYQWRKAGVDIPGAILSNYTIASVTTGDAGSYDVVISGICTPSVTSAAATLLVNATRISLGTAANFALFTVAGAVGNTGISQVSGNIGTNVGAITGFGAPSIVNGTIYNAEATTAQCIIDLQAAYVQLSTTPATNTAHAPAFGSGETLYPGVYSIAGAGSVAGNLTLDAQGDPNAMFIFQIGGAFTTGAGATIILINGSSSCNVFWVAEGAISHGYVHNYEGYAYRTSGSSFNGCWLQS